MLKHLIKISGILLLFVLVACGGTIESVEPSQSEQPEQVEEAAPVQMENAAEEEIMAEEEVLTVAGKPQLIEFYADW